MKKLTRWRRLLRRLEKKWNGDMFILAKDQSSNWRTCAIGDRIFQEFGQRVPYKITDTIAGEYLTIDGRVLGYHFADKVGKTAFEEAEKILEIIEHAPIEKLLDIKKYKKEVLVV